MVKGQEIKKQFFVHLHFSVKEIAAYQTEMIQQSTTAEAEHECSPSAQQSVRIQKVRNINPFNRNVKENIFSSGCCHIKEK